MKIDISVTELSRALYRVQGIADRKSTNPILAHALIKATTDQGLMVYATDTELSVTGHYEAHVDEEGAVAIPARQLYDIVKALPPGQVHMETKENQWLELTSNNSHFRLVGMPSDDFPDPQSIGNIQTFPVSADILSLMIDRTLFCASTDDNRQNLNGIFIDSPESKLMRMVATDGHRLAIAEQALDTDVLVNKGVIVPRKGFQEFKRVLGDGSGDTGDSVELGFSDKHALLIFGSVTLSMRLVEGHFPDYRQVIPNNPSRILKVSNTQLSEALKRVSLLSLNRAHAVRLSIDSGRLELLAEDPQFGDAREALEVEYEGGELVIGFNARYIQDILTLIQDVSVTLLITDDLSPVVIKPLEETGFLAVVMPVRI